jgi:gas vesicle protein
MSGNVRINGAVFGFAVGAAVGAGLALLLAPQPREETRQRVKDAARRVAGEAKAKVGRVRERLEDLEGSVTTEGL